MAERRMFAKSIVLSDAFLDMPLGARCLYMTMSMLADDDGFVSSPKAIMRQCGASEDDIRVLIGKSFLIPFESGVVVIKHWRINNYLRNDRYKATNYTEELKQLEIKENGAYTVAKTELGIPGGIPVVYPGKDSIGQDSIVQDSIGQNSIDRDIYNTHNIESIGANNGAEAPHTHQNVGQIDAFPEENAPKTPPKRTHFVPPTPMEVKAYCIEKGYDDIDPEYFCDFYESKGWMVGKNKMTKWRSAVSNWHRKNQEENKKGFYKPKEDKLMQAYREVLDELSTGSK